jgi:hypothetical protein
VPGQRAQLRTPTFRPLPVWERKILKPGGSGKVRRLGIPTAADRQTFPCFDLEASLAGVDPTIESGSRAARIA